MKKFLFATALGFAAAYWFFRLPHSYGKKLSGFIIAVFDEGNGDVIVKMNNDRHDFVLSDGLNLGIDLKKLQSKLIGKRSEIWFTHPKWPVDTTPHITRLISEDELVYSKW